MNKGSSHHNKHQQPILQAMRHAALLSLLLAALLLTACGGPDTGSASTSNSEAVRRTVTAEEGRELLDNTTGAVLLDVRTEEEYLESRIAGAVLLPVDNVGAEVEGLIPDKSTPIVVYCRSGRRSALAADTLEKLGYLAIYDMGGIIDWPYETVSGK